MNRRVFAASWASAAAPTIMTPMWALPCPSLMLLALWLPATGDGSGPDESDVSAERVSGDGQFIGRWKVVEFISSNGRPSAVSAKYTFEFSPGKLEWFDGEGKRLHVFLTQFESGRTPMEFTLFRRTGEKERRANGVYDYQDGLLRLYYLWDKPRPTKLERPEGGFIYVLRRENEEE